MSSTTELQTWLNGTPTGGPNSDGRYPLTAKDGQVYLVYCPAAQALNPSLADLPVQIYSEQAQAAAVGAATNAATADTARIAAQAAAASAAADSANALSSRNTATTQATNAAASAASALASKNAAEAAAASFVAGNYRRTDTAVPWTDLSSVPSFASRWPTYAEVTDKPTTFAPSAHNHDASEITAGILPAARFNDTTHGNRSGGALHAAATTSVAGFMAAADKLKLNGILSFGGDLAPLTISPRDFGVVDNTITTGLWRYSESDSDTGGPVNERGAILHTRRTGGGGETQLFLSESSARMFRRGRVTGAWTAWSEIARLEAAQTFTGVNVFTGGYLINRRDIPRVYLESPNQTNGYIIDANVSNTVYGNLRFLRRDNGTALAELNNAGDFVAIRTVLGRDLTSRGGTTGTQQIFRTMAYSDGIARLYDVMESDGGYSLYLLTSAGAPAPNAYQKFYIAQDARQVQFLSSGIVLGSTARTSYQPDATAALSGDLPVHVAANLSANYHNNNLLGVHVTGIYFATDNQMTWQYKSGSTWRLGATLSPGATAGSGAFSIDGQISDIAGNVRDIPPKLRNASANLTTADRGCLVYKDNTTAYSYSIQTGNPGGLTITVGNYGSSGNLTIARGSGVSLFNDAGTNADLVLTPGQTRTLYCINSTVWRVL